MVEKPLWPTHNTQTHNTQNIVISIMFLLFVCVYVFMRVLQVI